MLTSGIQRAYRIVPVNILRASGLSTVVLIILAIARAPLMFG